MTIIVTVDALKSTRFLAPFWGVTILVTRDDNSRHLRDRVSVTRGANYAELFARHDVRVIATRGTILAMYL